MIENKIYSVTVERTRTVRETCTVDIEATSWDDALQQVEDGYYQGHLEHDLVEVDYDIEEINFYRGYKETNHDDT